MAVQGIMPVLQGGDIFRTRIARRRHMIRHRANARQGSFNSLHRQFDPVPIHDQVR